LPSPIRATQSPPPLRRRRGPSMTTTSLPGCRGCMPALGRLVRKLRRHGARRCHLAHRRRPWPGHRGLLLPHGCGDSSFEPAAAAAPATCTPTTPPSAATCTPHSDGPSAISLTGGKREARPRPPGERTEEGVAGKQRGGAPWENEAPRGGGWRRRAWRGRQRSDEIWVGCWRR
jgi:hypothetical protein